MATLLHYPLCPFSRSIRLALAECGVEATLTEERPWDWRPEFLEINPAGSLPVLLVDAGTVWVDDVDRARQSLAALQDVGATWLEEPFVSGALDAYATLAREMNTSEGALKVAIHRLRKRYRELFRQEIADTVADPAEVESELRFLAAALTDN